MKGKILKTMSLLLLLCFAGLAVGCAGWRPIVVYRNNLYLGLFSCKTNEVNAYVTCSSLQGVGIATGIHHYGIGYYSFKKTIVMGFGDYHVKTPLVDLYSGTHASTCATDFIFKGGREGKNEPD